LPLINNEILVNIKTGRMHQIRATLKSKNMIISGDALYGSKDPKDAIELKQIFMRLKISDNTFKEWSL
jgi:23S rRNA-/tRNA-specific pseudouridylate synthase